MLIKLHLTLQAFESLRKQKCTKGFIALSGTSLLEY